MTDSKKKIIKQAVMIGVAALFIILGILSIVQATGSNAGLIYISKIGNVILRYVVVIVTNAIGIMLMSAAAGTFEGKVKNIFSISVCVYSTIMTVPLFLAFILMFPAAAGASLPTFLNDMVGEIVVAFAKIFKGGWQYLIYFLGTLMSIVFLAVPIISTYCTVKEIDLKELLGKMKKKKSEGEEQA
ncbi:MAG: hypothetical protein K2N32_00110 [Clostridia bacterium]|nr:hypothetical protein [Clostridia bacterium]